MIYADHNASSPLLKSVQDYLKNRFEKEPFYANPSSLHSLGQKVHKATEKCRFLCAQALGANPEQVIFNSGASEGISHIFFSVLNSTHKKTIITSQQEHAAVSKACRHYQQQGYKILTVKTLKSGELDTDHFKSLITSDIALVSLIAASNETGVIQPFQKIGQLCQEKNIPFLADTTQLIGKENFDFNTLPIDYAVASGHKLGALTGIGFILAKNPEKLTPMIFGGEQEQNKRSGTTNYLGIESLTIAIMEAIKNLPLNENLLSAQKNFEQKIEAFFPQAIIFGNKAKRISGVTLLGHTGLHGQAIQLELESYDIFVSTSSACSDNEPATSQTLKAMGINDDLGRSAIRISLKNDQGENEYQEIFKRLKIIYQRLGKIKF